VIGAGDSESTGFEQPTIAIAIEMPQDATRRRAKLRSWTTKFVAFGFATGPR